MGRYRCSTTIDFVARYAGLTRAYIRGRWKYGLEWWISKRRSWTLWKDCPSMAYRYVADTSSEIRKWFLPNTCLELRLGFWNKGWKFCPLANKSGLRKLTSGSPVVWCETGTEETTSHNQRSVYNFGSANNNLACNLTFLLRHYASFYIQVKCGTMLVDKGARIKFISQ